MTKSTVKQHLCWMNRLAWSIERNENNWVTARDMVGMLSSHCDPALNRVYAESSNVNARLKAPTMRYIPRSNRLTYFAKRDGRFETKQGAGNRRYYRLKEVTA